MKIHVADDGDDVGTFHVELFDGFLFEDSPTVKEFLDFPRIAEGDNITFCFTVPEAVGGAQSYGCDDVNDSPSRGSPPPPHLHVKCSNRFCYIPNQDNAKDHNSQLYALR